MRDNGGGHANHSFFWETMTANGLAWPRHAEPTGVLAGDIAHTFASFDAFREQLTAAALVQLGANSLAVSAGMRLRSHGSVQALRCGASRKGI